MRDKNPLWAWAVIFVTSAHARPDVRNFLTSGNGCVQSPSFPDHVTKKRRALGTRMVSRGKIVNFKHSHAPKMSLFRTFVSLQSEKSQVWSFSVSYSIRHAAEIWHTSHIFLGFESENSQVWSISILYFIQHAAKPAFNKDAHLISLWLLTSVCFYLVLFVTLEENDKCIIYVRVSPWYMCPVWCILESLYLARTWIATNFS